WLPESYEKDSTKRYVVIYMHDGQNLYDPAKSFIGVDWGMDETLTRLIQENKIQEAIIIGIWNTPKRFEEYMPQKAVEETFSKEDFEKMKKEHGGNELLSDNYLKFLVEELKPFIDSTFRTKPQKETTFIMGSSMGALISAYALCEYPEVFGGAGCVSTHWPAIEGCMLSYLQKNLPAPNEHKFYFDYGTKTLDAQYEPFQKKADAIIEKAGYVHGQNWLTKKFEGDEHSERAWRKRVYIPVEFFLAKN
ncbi:MAG: alpha/beta hydrolase, partial [Calditrichia bacterium]|nr:alpha/beta hydrolase [Calditrichia bacterium]